MKEIDYSYFVFIGSGEKNTGRYDRNKLRAEDIEGGLR